jgi:hypothetical protein
MWQNANQNDRKTIDILRRAMPYRLDDEAVDIIVEYVLGIRHDWRSMERTITLARCPQEVVWIEWNNLAFTRAQERFVGRLTEDPEEIPPRRGYLIRTHKVESTYSVTPVVELKQTGQVISLPFGMIVDTEGPVTHKTPRFPEPYAWMNEFEDEWNATVKGDVMWSMLNCPNRIGMHAEMRLANTLIEGIMKIQRDEGQPAAKLYALELIGGVINTVHGFAKTAVSMLCMLNEVPIRRFVYQPAGHFRAKGNLKPFLKNQIITLNLEKGRKTPLKVVQGIIKEAAWRCRAHMVKGYWRCDLVHTFDDSPGDKWRWQWSRRYKKECWQIWIKPHQRGDASLGWVNQQYEVTA